MKQYSFYLGMAQQFKYTVDAESQKHLAEIIKLRIGLPENKHSVVKNESGLPTWMRSLKVRGYHTTILFYEGE